MIASTATSTSRADADADGVATAAEVQQVLRAFDADGNGRLLTAERATVLRELGEVRVSHDERTVGVIPPPPRTATPRPQSGSIACAARTGT